MSRKYIVLCALWCLVLVSVGYLVCYLIMTPVHEKELTNARKDYKEAVKNINLEYFKLMDSCHE